MNDLKTPVRPGDLITADLFNAMLDELAYLRSRIGEPDTGLREVPRLVGLTLGNGQSLLASLGGAFHVRDALDIHGATRNPNTGASRALRVLNQVPPPGILAAGGPIDVVLAAPAGGTAPQPVPSPTLSAFNPNPVEIDAELTITGANFGTPPSAVSVTVDGVPAALDGLRRQDTVLVVTVPTLAPAPPAGGREVEVVVTAAGGSVSSNTLPAASRPHVIPASGTRPEITEIRDDAGAVVAPSGRLLVQGQLTITGRNFLAGGDNRVVVTVSGNVEEFPVPPANASATQLRVDVPRPSSLSSTNRRVSGTLQVQAGADTANRSAAITVRFELPR